MEKLEGLLNRLIEKGWKPFNVDCDWTNVEVINRLSDNRYIPEHSEIIFQTDTHRHVFDCNIRDLVSKSSWLWQFVCDKWLVKKDWDINKDMEKYMYKCEYMNWDWHTRNYRKRSKFTHHYFYEYFIIESSLKDESELEEFLLSNIKL